MAVGDLVRRLWDDCGYATTAQLVADGAAGVGLVSANSVWSCARPAAAGSMHPQLSQQLFEEGGIVGLSGGNQDHQRPASAVDEMVDLAGQAAARAAYRVVRRLDARIRVIRPTPLCGE